MKLYNTLTHQTEELKPINPPNIGLYACGFTVYDYTHLGHLRKYTMDDILIRVLKHAGFKVKFVQNVTDVGHLTSDADTGEDKLEKGARKYKQTVWDVAKKFEDYFFTSMDSMGNLRPDVSCRVTDHIPEQIELVKTLEEKGFTYEIEGDGIYFDTSKFPDYGKMARLNKDGLKEGVRVETVGKRNPTDFALWKFEKEGDNRAMVWESPWHKRSFPGWHVECSAMSMKYLGEQFDIHTGGIDHIPVHHSNEIAQSEAATGKKPGVRHWVHHNFLRVEGEKMSKSLGNFFTIDDIEEKGFSPRALRLLFLTSHYRSELNFTWDALAGAEKNYKKLSGMVSDLKEEVGSGEDLKVGNYSSSAQEFKEKFFGFLEDDLRTPEAVTVLQNVLKSDLPAQEKLGLVSEFDEVFQLSLGDGEENKEITISPELKLLLDERKTAREQNNWQKSDQIRDQVAEMGFKVEDLSDGTQELLPID